MSTRVGIELASRRCRVIAADVRRVTSTVAPVAPVRVRAFDAFDWDPDNPQSLTTALQLIRASSKLPRRAAVVFSDVESVFKFLQLPPAAPPLLDGLARREAEEDLARLGSAEAIASSVMLGDLQEGAGPPRRDVAFLAASNVDIRQRLQPITAAGFVVDSVGLPATALTSLARLLPTGDVSAPVAYLAIGDAAMHLAIVRAGVLHFARELPWGYDGQDADQQTLAARLASDLRRSFLLYKQSFKRTVDRLVLCGQYPHLRALTAPLMEALGAQVETLDTMSGIDLRHLPAPQHRFRADVATLRLAWAAAADGTQPLNLLPRDFHVRRERSRLGLAVGAAAALVLAAYVPMDRAASAKEQQIQQLRQRLDQAEPALRAAHAAQQASAIDAARSAALDTFDLQGPRLARALEHLAHVVPEGITLTAVSVTAHGAAWHATIAGVAHGDDASASIVAVNTFLRGVADSPYFGEPLGTPSLTIGARRGVADPVAAADQGSAGQRGVAFTAELPVPR